MLQFKRPRPNVRGISWSLTLHQHKTMKNRRYIFYCLPRTKNRTDMETVLYSCLFKRASFAFVSILRPSLLRYPEGWYSFVSKVIACTYGKKLVGNDVMDDDEYGVPEIDENLKIDLQENMAIFALSSEDKKMKIIANEKIIKKSNKS